MSIEVRFPGGLAVDAFVKGRLIHTDQPAADGGGESGPSPFDIFLASLATCAGYYAVRFCRERSIPTDGLALAMDTERDPASHLVSDVRIRLTPPEGFPEKYLPALVRAVDQCTVKKHLAHPPQVESAVTPALRLVTS